MKKSSYCIIYISNKRPSSSLFLKFYPFPFTLFFFFPTFFVLILSYMSGTRTIFFANIIWVELSLVFWTFLSGTFFPGGGGGARARTDIDLSLSMIILAFFPDKRRGVYWSLASWNMEEGAFIYDYTISFVWRRGVHWRLTSWNTGRGVSLSLHN